ncbi:unnamed protein product [Citrullus colocynthis]|uniref:Uncharacterized protein n=1 Tax=Citrullus colocynthis TaxID=252529 RepID=A0ABP0XPF3_9ROSI
MEKFTGHCSSLCSSSSLSSSFTQSRLNLAIVSTLLASICFLTLRFSPSFLTLLLLIPSTLFLAKKKKSDSLQISATEHLFDEKPQTTVEEESAAQIGDERSSDDETSTSSSSSNNGGLRNGDFNSDLWMYLDELTRNLPFSEDLSSEDDDSLIEIPLLPNMNAIRNLDTCLPDLLPDSVLRQHGFVELLEEINEEDNLIEIDISKGFNRFSTVCN